MQDNNQNDFFTQMDLLVKATALAYPGKAAPGVTVSLLPNDMYYVSVVSYENGMDDKRVELACKSESLPLAIEEMSKRLASSVYGEQ